MEQLHNLDNIYNDRLISIKDVKILTSLSQSTIYRKVQSGEFPKSHRISANRKVWRLSEVKQWIDQFN